jgi:Cu+-exporting ATPase
MRSPVVADDEGVFCCSGCHSVHYLLREHRVLKDEERYNITGPSLAEYAYLEEEDVIKQLTSHRSGSWSVVHFSIPNIHCSSCIYLLENIMRLHNGITSCRVNFLSKEASFTFDETMLSLRELVELLVAIDYPPRLQYEQLEGGSEVMRDYSLLIKMGVAGFFFGNIMLLSFPDYIGSVERGYAAIFGWINILFSLPVVFYSAWDYLKSASLSLRSGHLNIDVPVTLGILTLFTRSVYEITTGVGTGYLDSLSGFVFFLLIGRWFQNITYDSISFDRDYKSYFPISIMKRMDNQWQSTGIQNIEIGDELLIRDGELIPADSEVLSGRARIDYSFVTGEAAPIRKEVGDEVLAGGRQRADSIRIRVLEKIDQSYLTRLWDQDPFHIPKSNRLQKLMDQIGKYFTWGIVLLAIGTLLYWLGRDYSMAFIAATAVLIIACPCALALSTPFTYGNVVRILRRKGMFLRNIQIVTQLQDINHIVFDKTGTLTNPEEDIVTYHGRPLTEKQKVSLSAVALQSQHPMSRALQNALARNTNDKNCEYFEEYPGQGIKGLVDGREIRLGSAAFILGEEADETGVWVEIDGQYQGYFSFKTAIRKGTREIVDRLHSNRTLHILSGDGEHDRARLEEVFPANTPMHFQQSPADKLAYIQNLQASKGRVLFIGDGLNDAGALRQADVGIVVSHSSQQFSPSSDVILDANCWSFFSNYFEFIRNSKSLLYIAFIFAGLYNLIGLFFAVQGLLSPVVAAVLMPLSSISIILLGFAGSYSLSYFYFRNSSK